MNIEEVWSQYRNRIKAFLHSRVSNSSDVDDLLQEILIKVFAGLPKLEDTSKVHSWLFQITHRTIIDHYRSNSRSKDIHPDDLWYEDSSPEVRRDLERCVEPFIAALPDETAQLLKAVDIEGQSQKAYAQEQGLSYSTLKSRVQSGRNALRAVFEQCCHLTLDTRGNIADFDPKSNACDNC